MADQDDREPEIPPEIAAAWGIRDRPSKGPKPGLSVGRIVDAAIRTAVVGGVSAVSMNRVAGELGTAAMSLYRHVANKDELLVLMVDEALGPPPDDVPSPSDDWRGGLSRWATSTRDRWLANPWALSIPITGAPLTPNQVRWMERCLRCLADTGLEEGEKLGVMLLVTGYVRDSAALTAGIDAALQRPGQAEAHLNYSRLLRQLVDPERFPAITRLLDSGALDEAAEDDVSGGEDMIDFHFGLERILDGIGALIDQRRQ